MNDEARTQYSHQSTSDDVPNQASSGLPRTAWSTRVANHGVSRYGRIALTLLLLASNGCRSAFEQRIWIPCSKITEDELKAKGLKYEKYQLTRERLKRAGIECPDETVEWYVVEKSGLQKLGDTVLGVGLAPVVIPAYCVVMGGALLLATIEKPIEVTSF